VREIKMDNLIRVLGPAPSELSDKALAAKLITERSRVRLAIERFKAIPQKAAKQRSAAKIVKDSGFSVEEIMRLIEEEKNAQG
jgi:hypothetical protein